MMSPKTYYILRVALTTLVGVLIGGGVLFLSAYAVEAFDIFLIAMGVISLVSNFPTFVLSLHAIIGKTKWEWINLVISVVGMGLGVLFIALQREAKILPFLLGVYAAVLPFVRTVLVEEQGAQLRRELPKILIGGFMLVACLFEAEGAIFRVLGFAFLGISALYLLLRLLTAKAYFRAYAELEAEIQRSQNEEN